MQGTGTREDTHVHDDDEKNFDVHAANNQPEETTKRISSKKNTDLGETTLDAAHQTEERKGNTYDELGDVSGCVFFFIVMRQCVVCVLSRQMNLPRQAIRLFSLRI